MTDSSILMPFVPSRPEQILPFAALTQWSSARCLWQGQGLTTDTQQVFGFAAASGFRTPVGTSVSLMPFCHPYDAALRAQSLAACVGHPVVAGFGPGGASLQQSILGAPYRSQLGAVRDYVTIVRDLLADGKVEHEGEFFSCRAHLTRVPRPDVEIGLGVLRPRMAELAGELADVAITWLAPADYLRDTLMPALRAGAARAARRPPRVVAIVPIALSGPGRDAVQLALAGNTGHMSLPHYVDMLDRAGIRVDVHGDAAAAAAALVAGDAFLFGDESELAAKVAAYAAAGVDEVVLNVTGVAMTQGGPAALRELETLLRSVVAR